MEEYKQRCEDNIQKIIDSLEIKGMKFKEFVLKSKQDYTNTIAGLLTPALRGLYLRFNVRTPVFFYTANRERAESLLSYLLASTTLLKHTAKI